MAVFMYCELYDLKSLINNQAAVEELIAESLQITCAGAIVPFKMHKIVGSESAMYAFILDAAHIVINVYGTTGDIHCTVFKKHDAEKKVDYARLIRLIALQCAGNFAMY